MNSFFLDSAFAGVAISLIAYMAGTFLKKKLKLGLFNPLLISIPRGLLAVNDTGRVAGLD